MSRHSVDISNDHLIRQAKAPLRTSIAELIWNGLDAGGDRVIVRFNSNNIDGVESIEVEDRGDGIPFKELDRSFGKIGKSLKMERKRNSANRVLHGEEGRGRFRAINLGSRITWSTIYQEGEGLYQYSITIRADSPKDFDVPVEPSPVHAGATGTVVRVENLVDGINRLTTEETRDELAEQLALYLIQYPDVTVKYDGEEINVASLVDREAERLLEPIEGSEYPATLHIIEWDSTRIRRKLFIADERGFAWHELAPRIHAPELNFCAYVKCKEAREWEEHGLFQTAEISPEILSLTERARNGLREYRNERLAEDAQGLVEKWKQERIYPFREADPASPVEKAERQVFDIVASRVHRYHSPFRSADRNSQHMTLQLVRQALEANPTSLRRILDDVLNLPKKQQDELAELLQTTSLPGIIQASSTVRDRLRALDGFDEIIFGKNWKKRLRERTQLHRLLVHNLWIFGEEYMLDTDDEPLRAVLEKHLKYLGRELLAEEKNPKLIGDKDGIPDLMLSRKIRRDRGHLEHFVVELKAPRVVLGSEEITQIEKYAFAVADDERFSKDKVSWKFVLIGNSWDKFAERKATEKERPFGCIGDHENLTIWLYQWSDVIHEARSRYNFFSEHLEIETSSSEGVRYLQEKYNHLMAGKGMTKKQEAESLSESEGEVLG